MQRKGKTVSKRKLLTGGHIVTMDPAVGELPKGDILIEDDKILTIAPDISADAEIIDLTGHIVIPGMIDTHRHTWETSLRGCAPDSTLAEYFTQVLDDFAPAYRAEDVYAANLAGALECLNAGITTLVDWSHINNTPDHGDAAVRGLAETGIRAQYAYGWPNKSMAEFAVNSKIPVDENDVRRIRDTYFSSDEGLLTMGLAVRGPGFSADEVVVQEWRLARELGLPLTLHTAMGDAGRWGMVEQLNALGLLGPDTTYVHACHLSDREWQLVAESGGTVSVSPQVEMQMGHGWPPLVRAIEAGLRPSLSVDVVTTVPGDMFTQMRAAFAVERGRAHAATWADGTAPERSITARDVFTMATVNGAHVARVEDRTGTLTPGKQADIVAIDATAINVSPVIDAVAAVTLSADVSNVSTVLVAGEVRKRDGRLTGDLAAARRLVEDSRDYLLAQSRAKAAARA